MEVGGRERCMEEGGRECKRREAREKEREEEEVKESTPIPLSHTLLTN